MSAKVAKVRCRLYISIGCTGNMSQDRSIRGFFGHPQPVFFGAGASGKRTVCELEHGPVEIVDLLYQKRNNGDFP